MRFGDYAGAFEIDSLPGNPQVAVSHAVYVKAKGKGHGKAQHAQRLGQLSRLCYDYVLCTVDTANDTQVHILEQNGWTKLDSFTSSKTSHLVAIYGRRLKP